MIPTIFEDDRDEMFTEPEYLQLEKGLPEDVAWVVALVVAQPSLYFTNPSFFLRATETLARGKADFETLPILTSLEIIEGMKKLKAVSKTEHFSDDVKLLITELLREDGVQHPHPPFDFLDPSKFRVTDEGRSKEQKKAFQLLLESHQ